MVDGQCSPWSFDLWEVKAPAVHFSTDSRAGQRFRSDDPSAPLTALTALIPTTCAAAIDPSV